MNGPFSNEDVTLYTPENSVTENGWFYSHKKYLAPLVLLPVGIKQRAKCTSAVTRSLTLMFEQKLYKLMT